MPVCIEAKDKSNKKLANGAFRKLLRQKIKHDSFGAIPTYIFNLQKAVSATPTRADALAGRERGNQNCCWEHAPDSAQSSV